MRDSMRNSSTRPKHSTPKHPKLVLLDRDGVLNHDSTDYIRAADDWDGIAGSIEAIAALNQAGIRCALCTNQSGIGRGIFDHAALAGIHQKMLQQIGAAGGRLELIRYCPHLPDAGCSCRKPAPGLLLECCTELGVAPEDTLFVGDSLSDVQAALQANCASALVRYDKAGRATDAIEAQARALGVELVYDDLAQLVKDLVAN